MTDLELRLREAMGASVAGAMPSFSAADVRRRHRRHLRRVAATITAGTATAAVVVMVTALATWERLPGPGSEPVGTSLAGRYADPSFGWQIRYPRGWVLGHFQDQGMVTADGIRVTNFAPDLSAPSTGIPAMGWLRTFPANGVAVQIWFTERTPIPPPLRDSSFPLSPASFSPVGRFVGGSEPTASYRVAYGDGFAFNAAVWIGPRASGADERAAWAVVRSLRFPALTERTIWHDRFYVLGPAARYPVGSVTAFPASSLPRGPGFERRGFYLIHAPRAFYVVSATFASSVGSASACAVAYDRGRRQFYCPGTKLRWDITGQPLATSEPGGADEGLGPRIATVAQDGHVLYCPFFGALLGTRLNGNPWG